MRKMTIIFFSILYCVQINIAQNKMPGLRGKPEAVAEAEAMVETMGGLEIWSKMKSIHFVHRWYFWNRVDSYVENEILDLTGPRSWIEMKSEIYHRLRASSPEQKYWNVINGEFSYGTDEQSQELVEGAPFHIVRIAKGIAIGDPFYEVRIGKGTFRDSRQLEFYGPDGKRGSSIVINAKHEPLVWIVSTNKDEIVEFSYTFGPMESYGNLRMPKWASTGNGAVTYDMISLTGSNQPPESSLFIPSSNK